MEAVIRGYRDEDLPTLREITVASFGEVSIDRMIESQFGRFGQGGWQERKARQIDEDVRVHAAGVFVAERAGAIVGYITTRVDADNGKGRIPNLAVVESARGQGLGRRLIEHALDYFRSLNLDVAIIETMENNSAGQRLYPACGFVEIGRQIHYAQRLTSPPAE